ncbi:MAG TPA: lipocalin family protein [Terracidiphilus sp.]
MIRARTSGILLAAGTICAAVMIGKWGRRDAVQVVPSVDLFRYMGTWYEIAHLPAWFQRSCSSNTTASYGLRPDGKVTVLNQCRTRDGKLKSAKGIARVASKKGPNTKLKVSFFGPFAGDYWIIDLDPEYQWAVVGDPHRRYLWILSRQPRLDPETYARVVERAKTQGFDVSRLMRTQQS